MTASADSYVPTKVLSYDHTLFLYFPSYVAFIIDNYNYWSLLRKCLGMKIFLLFTTIYSKSNMTVVQAISPRQ